MDEQTASSEEQGFLVARGDWAQDRAVICRIRRSAFPTDEDEADPDCVHILAYDMSGNTIGAARMRPNGRIGRMAVIDGWRRRGVGSALLQALIELAREHGLEQVHIHTHMEAAPFYHQHGFMGNGEPFVCDGIEYQPMSRYVTDPADTTAW